MKPQLVGLLVAVVAMAFSQPAFAEEPTVGVAVTSTLNADEEVAQGVAQTLAEALGKTLKVSARAAAQDELPPETIGDQCVGDTTCMVLTANALQVDQLLMLVVIGFGDDLKVEATWLDVATRTTELRPSVITAQGDGMLDALSKHAPKLLPKAELRESATAAVNTNANTLGDSRDVFVEGDASVVSGPERRGRTLGTTGTIALYSGAGLFAGALAYGGYRRAECGAFRSCPDGPDRKLDVVADIAGVAGVVSMSVAAYLYFTSDSAEEVPPVAFSASSESVGVSFSGLF